MRAPQAGETITTRVKGSFPVPDGRVVREGTVVAEFWRPGRDPRSVPSERDTPDYCSECTFDQRISSWTARVSTEGWAPGTWTMRGRLATVAAPGETAQGWDWLTFELAA
jgi:hypothetical protein